MQPTPYIAAIAVAAVAGVAVESLFRCPERRTTPLRAAAEASAIKSGEQAEEALARAEQAEQDRAAALTRAQDAEQERGRALGQVRQAELERHAAEQDAQVARKEAERAEQLQRPRSGAPS